MCRPGQYFTMKPGPYGPACLYWAIAPAPRVAARLIAPVCGGVARLVRSSEGAGARLFIVQI